MKVCENESNDLHLYFRINISLLTLNENSLIFYIVDMSMCIVYD